MSRSPGDMRGAQDDVGRLADGRALPAKIAAYLNQGDTVIAEVSADGADKRCFVRIRPLPNLATPREAHRYLNSRFSMWEYWHYEFRSMLFRPGWDAPEAFYDYDLFLLQDERRLTCNEQEFHDALKAWVPDPSVFQHAFDSDCPE